MVPTSLPPWPTEPPTYGGVQLRKVEFSDVAMARELSTDPYVPQIGSLPKNADDDGAMAWVHRQQQRYWQGSGFSFTIVQRSTDRAVGHCGLWLTDLEVGRASAGYSMVPSARGQGLAGDALRALTGFAWTIPLLQRIVLAIEPGNTASLRVAQRAGYRRAGSARDHQWIGDRKRAVYRYTAERPTYTGTSDRATDDQRSDR